MRKRVILLISFLIIFVSLFSYFTQAKIFAAAYSSHLGFTVSGALNPPQLYPSTFETLHVNWSAAYGSSAPNPNLPLAAKKDPNGYFHLNNTMQGGVGNEFIDITPWTKPTLFPVYSREQLVDIVAKNGQGAYYQIGSESNVITNINGLMGRFEFGSWHYGDFWTWFLSNGSTYNIDTTTSAQGEASMRIDAPIPGQHWLKSHSIDKVESSALGDQIIGGKKYRATVAIKTENVVADPNRGVGLHIYENGVWPGTAKGGGKTPMLTGTNDWQEYSFDFITQPTTTYIEILIGMGFGVNASGTAWFDNIRISKVDDTGVAISEKKIRNYFTGDQFAPIYHHYVSLLKDIDPTSKIVGPNFLTWSELPPGETEGIYGLYTPGKTWFDAFLSRYQSLYQQTPTFDIYATHVYDNYRPWDLAEYLRYAKQNVEEFRAYINEHFGTDKIVWITEFGVQTRDVPETEVSRFLDDMHHYLKSRNDIGKWFWAWSLAPIYYPFSGYLFENNSDGSPLTIVGQKFAELALTDALVVGDLNQDGKVNILDYNLLLFDFGKNGTPNWLPADLNSDGKVNIFDYNLMVRNYGR